MYWPYIAVQILIIAVISNDSFPIDLKEIQQEDIYLVDKARKGRFIAVNQTTFEPNPIELIREKKSSKHNKEVSEVNVMVPDSLMNETTIATRNDSNLTKNVEQKHGESLLTAKSTVQNNSTCTESLIEPQTFAISSFFEDELDRNRQPIFSNLMLRAFNDENDCHFDRTNYFTNYFPCIDEFIIREENLFC